MNNTENKTKLISYDGESSPVYLIDTDIGDDIDDSLALYLAMSMGLHIVGITTVFKDTRARARMVKKFTSLYGKGYESIPVYAGYGDTVTEHTEKEALPLWDSKWDWNIAEEVNTAPSDAIDFIASLIEKYKKRLTVIALGPFTNIARVLKKDPDAFNKVGRFVIMGGAYYRQYADWNVMCDPEAARLMFELVRNMECIGADVTHTLSIGDDGSNAILGYSKNDKALMEIKRQYGIYEKINESRAAVLHDPLAVGYAAGKVSVEMEEGRIAVITDGPARGLTFNVTAYGKEYMNKAGLSKVTLSQGTRVARSLDSDEFVKRFMRLFD